MAPQKECHKCGAEKTATMLFFGIRKSSSDGLSTWCRICLKKYHQRYREAHKKKAQDRDADFYKENKSRVKARTRAYHQKNYIKLAPSMRRRRLKANFGITPEDYEVLHKEQKGCCAVCARRSETRRLDVDHDHKSGKIRGLLCRRCNLVLGHMKDDPALLRQAAAYLEEE